MRSIVECRLLRATIMVIVASTMATIKIATTLVQTAIMMVVREDEAAMASVGDEVRGMLTL